MLSPERHSETTLPLSILFELYLVKFFHYRILVGWIKIFDSGVQKIVALFVRNKLWISSTFISTKILDFIIIIQEQLNLHNLSVSFQKYNVVYAWM